MIGTTLALIGRASPALLLAIVAGAAGLRAQDSRAIFQSWIGKTLDVEVPNSSDKVTVVFHADGTASMTGSRSDTGKWRLDETGYCASWRVMRAGREACFTIVPMGGSFLLVVKGTNDIASKATLR